MKNIEMGICIFGVGDCAAVAEATLKYETDVINKSLSEMFLSQLQSHRAQGNVLQKVSGKSLKGDVTISNINLKNMVSITIDSWQKMQNDAKLKETLNNAVNNIVDATMKSTSGFLSGNAESRLTGELKNTINNEINTKVTVRQVNECIADVYVEQVVEGETRDGNVTITAINMENTSNIVANCVADVINSIVKESATVNQVVNEVNAELEATSKGPLESLASLFESIGKNIMLFIIVLVVIAIFVVGGIIAFNVFSKRGGTIKMPKRA